MIVISKYDPKWPEEFERIKSALQEILGDLALRIDHIGSTSVPGLGAKDVIDIQVTVRELDPLIQRRLVKAGYKEIHKDLYLVPIEIGQVVRLNNVFFDFDKWDLRPESFIELDRVVKLLKENPAIEIEMSAHTDSYGSDEYNFKLSDNRARSVMEYILSKGIEPKRIISQGYGEAKPVAENDTPENRQLNRRVEFTILKN